MTRERKVASSLFVCAEVGRGGRIALIVPEKLRGLIKSDTDQRSADPEGEGPLSCGGVFPW